MPNPFLYKQFHLKQSSLARVHCLIVKKVLFQAIQFCQTVLYQTIQFSIGMQFSSTWPIDRKLSCATTAGQREPGSDGNGWILHIPQSSSITGVSSSDCLVSYPGHSLEGVLPLQRSNRCILQPQPTAQMQTVGKIRSLTLVRQPA